MERFAREQGWSLADSPADADVLVLAGSAGGLGQFADRIWDQLPGPRSRVRITADDGVNTLLEQARSELADLAAQRRDERRTSRPPAADPSAHAGHDMAGMDLPGGLGMAERAPDRDGLKLDVLTVPWGPALPWWPAGLALTTLLQGDVVAEARVERLGDRRGPHAGWTAALAQVDPATAVAVVRLDALVRLLAVAGWDGARLACQRVRDNLLTGAALSDVAPGMERLGGRVGRSRALARMTSGIATTQDEDITLRYRRWLGEAVSAVASGTMPQPREHDDDALERLPELVVGTEVGTARLVVASLDLELSGAALAAAACV